jgi:hypothetical protein
MRKIPVHRITFAPPDNRCLTPAALVTAETHAYACVGIRVTGEAALPFVSHAGRNVLFVHIPRTGGTTVEHWLRSLGDLRLFAGSIPAFTKVTPQHLRANDIDELMGEDFFDYAFAIVRNPFDRLASEYRARRSLALEGFWRTAPRFPGWLESSLEALRNNPFHLDNHLRPQWDFVSRRVKVFHYEMGLPAILAQVAAEIGAPPPADLPRKLATQAMPGDVSFDVAETERVLGVYGRDFDIFGYSKALPKAA